MKVSEAGTKFIAAHEGCQLSAYPDVASTLALKCRLNHISIYDGGYKQLKDWVIYNGDPWTIGYGATGGGVFPGLIWTQSQADENFDRQLETLSEMVSGYLQWIDVTQNQFDAMVSFAYNVGPGRLLALIHGTKLDSTEQRKLIFANAMLKYNRASHFGEPHGRINLGLMRRRQEERALFLKTEEVENGRKS